KGGRLPARGPPVDGPKRADALHQRPPPALDGRSPRPSDLSDSLPYAASRESRSSWSTSSKRRVASELSWSVTQRGGHDLDVQAQVVHRRIRGGTCPPLHSSSAAGPARLGFIRRCGPGGREQGLHVADPHDPAHRPPDL